MRYVNIFSKRKANSQTSNTVRWCLRSIHIGQPIMELETLKVVYKEFIEADLLDTWNKRDNNVPYNM